MDEALANLEEALGLYFEGEDLPDSFEPPIITTVLLPVRVQHFPSFRVKKLSPRSRKLASY